MKPGQYACSDIIIDGRDDMYSEYYNNRKCMELIEAYERGVGATFDYIFSM